MGNTAETHVNPFWNVNVVPFWSLKGKKWVMPCFPVIYTFISRFLRHNLRKMLPKRSGRVTLQFQTVFCVPCTDMFYFSLSQESHIETQCNLHHIKWVNPYVLTSAVKSYPIDCGYAAGRNAIEQPLSPCLHLCRPMGHECALSTEGSHGRDPACVGTWQRQHCAVKATVCKPKSLYT